MPNDNTGHVFAEVEAINITPILTPILALLKSRKFFYALLSCVLAVLSTQVPALAPYQELVFVFLAVVFSVAIYGTAYEDAHKDASQFLTDNPIKDPKGELRDLLIAVLDEYPETAQAVRGSAQPTGVSYGNRNRED